MSESSDLSGRSRASIWGAVAVLAVATFYAVFLPSITNAVTDGDELIAGEPYPIVDGLEITPAAGWSIAAESELIVTLTKAGATFAIVPPSPRIDLAGASQTAIDSFESDPTRDWQIGGPRSFLTDVGDDAIIVVGLSPTSTQPEWFIGNDDTMTTILASTPNSVWHLVSDDMDSMARSVVFTGGGQ